MPSAQTRAQFRLIESSRFSSPFQSLEQFPVTLIVDSLGHRITWVVSDGLRDRLAITPRWGIVVAMDGRHEKENAGRQAVSDATERPEPAASNASEGNDGTSEKPSILDVLTLSGPGEAQWPKRERTALAFGIAIAVAAIAAIFF